MYKVKVMKSTSQNVCLSMAAAVVAIILIIVVFESIENIRYARWRASYDNGGWLGRVTVPSDNPVLMWEYRPYGEFEQYKMNRYGFRDFDYSSMNKPDNTLRIAFAGDSITLGYKVNADETLERQFEIEANNIHSQQMINALNFGVDAYGTPQVYEMIRTKVLNFSPDEVVYVMCFNDFDFTEHSTKMRYFKKPKSFLLRRIEHFYMKARKIDYHLYYFQKNKDIVFQSLINMRDILKLKAVNFMVVIVPPFYKTSLNNYPLLQMHEDIRGFLEKNKIKYFDLLETFYGNGESPVRYAFDVWHPNADGCKKIAKQILLPVLSNAVVTLQGKNNL